MMISGTRKGCWGVPPYERIGGRALSLSPKR